MKLELEQVDQSVDYGCYCNDSQLAVTNLSSTCSQNVLTETQDSDLPPWLSGLMLSLSRSAVSLAG